jgi:hypothetical protein
VITLWLERNEMDYVITITLKNVAKADALDLVEQLNDRYGADYDAHLGDFVVRASEDQNGTLFPIQEED